MAKIEKGIIIQSSSNLLVWRGDLLMLPCISIAGLVRPFFFVCELEPRLQDL